MNNTNENPVAGILGEPFSDYNPPSWDVYFMRLSYETALKSRDPSTKFGAIIVRDKRPVLFGYNGLPPGVKDLPERYQRPEKYKWVVHAEENVIACGAKFGISTEGTSLYIPAMPCAKCASMIVAAGISKLILHRPAVEIFSRVSPYGTENTISLTNFEEAGIVISYVDMFVGKVAYFGGMKYNI